MMADSSFLRNCLYQIRHLDRGMSRIRTAVARLCAAALNRLLDILGGNDSVNRRSALFDCELPERLGDLSVDVVRMCSGP